MSSLFNRTEVQYGTFFNRLKELTYFIHYLIIRTNGSNTVKQINPIINGK